MQRRLASGDLKAFLVARVSARALIILLPIEGSLAQWGTSPQCMGSTRRVAPSTWTT